MMRTKEATSSVGGDGYKVSCLASCTRCGGLMVNELSIDLWSCTSELECGARRCVQCGDVIDAVILRNRTLHQQSMATQRKPVYVH